MNLKTKQLEADLAKSTQQTQSLENIFQELTAKISNLVTNERVVKLETRMQDAEESVENDLRKNVTGDAKLIKKLDDWIEEVAKEARNRPCKLADGLNNRLKLLE